MTNTHSILASLGLIIAVAVILFFFLRINGDKTRQLMEQSDEQQKNDHAEDYGNAFEMLKLARSNLETLKIAIQYIISRNKIGTTNNSDLLPQLESSAAKENFVESRNFVMESDMAEDAVVEKKGAVDEIMDSSILEHKIAKATENILGLNDALKRLLAEKERARAEAASEAMDVASDLCSFRPYLPFLLGDELFAVGMATVQEVLQATRLFVGPGMPEKIRSAINLDGSVVPVIDLNNYFGGEITKVSRNTLIVILLLKVNGDLQKVGIKVDGVGKIIMVDQRDVVPSLAKADRVRNDFAQGEYKTEFYSVTLLDFNQGLTLQNILGLNYRYENFPSSLSKKCNVYELLY